MAAGTRENATPSASNPIYPKATLLKTDNDKCAKISNNEPNIIKVAALPFLSTIEPKIGVNIIVPKGMRLAVLGPFFNQIAKVSHIDVMKAAKRIKIIIKDNIFPLLFFIFEGTRENASPKINKTI